MTYRFLDSGNGQKLEAFGPFTLVRPCAQAVWKPSLPEEVWKKRDAYFTREDGNRWHYQQKVPSSWEVELQGVKFKISPTEFGHLGVFPEHANLWEWMDKKIQGSKRQLRVLNLFAYSGGASLALAKAGCSVCHLDASKGMVDWARENAARNNLEKAPIRWIVDDVTKFLARELRRGVQYDGVILDPPSFGRGAKGELFKIEEHLTPILEACRSLLSNDPAFFVFSAHTTGFTPVVMGHLLSQLLKDFPGKIETGEMLLQGKNTLDLPCGSFARWSNE